MFHSRYALHMASASTATTRTATAVWSGPPIRRARDFFAAGEVITSGESGLRYRILRLLGQGGYGEVYLAKRVGPSKTVPETICIKVSDRLDGWLREAYFGQVLDGHPRAIQVFESFPLMRAGEQILYCLALEYARY